MNEKDDRFLTIMKDFIRSLVISFIFVFILTQFIFQPVRVEGLSMYPSLNDKELGFSNIFSARHLEIKRFDVVVIYLEEQNKFIVKRVVGLPGETLEYRDEKLYIDDEVVEEPFLDNDYRKKFLEDDREFTEDIAPITIDSNSYYVLGDNRINSTDSRNYGTFDKKKIKSKNIFVFLPLDKMRRVNNQ